MTPEQAQYERGYVLCIRCRCCRRTADAVRITPQDTKPALWQCKDLAQCSRLLAPPKTAAEELDAILVNYHA